VLRFLRLKLMTSGLPDHVRHLNYLSTTY
jgi:hypothetical protein